jgi:hypothetical protein
VYKIIFGQGLAKPNLVRHNEEIMGTATIPPQVKLFVAAMFDASMDHKEVQDVLTGKFGRVDATYGPVAFGFTEYYKDEMGENCKKIYLTFEQLIPREALAGIKTFTNEVEQRYTSNGKRRLNLDPGYIAPDKLVLASTKDFYHRLYLSQGIFAEVTLHYRKGSYRHFSWTYPDYKEPEFLEFLERARAGYMKEVRSQE